MEASHTSSRYWRVGDLVLDQGKRQLRRGTKVLNLPRLSYRLFIALVEAAPDVLTHEQLYDLVWPGRPASPENLAQRIKLLRRSLGDDAENPKYIGAVRGVGYRLLVDVVSHASDESAGGVSGWLRSHKLVIGAAVVLVTLAAFLLVRNLPDASTVAVLPFANGSDLQEDLYLSDGIGDDLRDGLARINGLRVAARTSSVRFRDAADPRTASDDLHVANVVTGLLHRRNDQLQITVRIIDGRTGFQRWSHDFADDTGNLPELQQTIVEAVAGQLLPDGAAAAAALAAVPSTASAYEMMLLARHYFQQVRENPIVDLELLQKAIDLYEKATQADPDSALAQSRLAAALLYYGDIERAEAPVFRALELQPDSSEVQLTLGLYRLGGGLSNSGQPLQRAVELNPNNVEALSAFALWNWTQGDWTAAEPYFREALSLDRLSIDKYRDIGNFYGMGGYRDEALEIAEEIEIRFNTALAYEVIARIHELIGDIDVAIGYALRAREIDPNYKPANWMLAELHARIGDWEGVLRNEPDPGPSPLYFARRYNDLIKLAGELLLENPNQELLSFMLARAYSATGKFEQVVSILENRGLPDVVYNDSRRSNSVEGLVNLSDALYQLGRIDEARELALWAETFMERVVSTDPYHQWWGSMNLACARSILGKDKDALFSLETMLESPGLPWYPFVLDQPCLNRFAGEPRYDGVIAALDERRRNLRERLPATLERMRKRPP